MSRFVYVNLVANRAKELDGGQRALVPVRERSPIEVAIDEIAQGKVTAEVKSAHGGPVRDAKLEKYLSQPEG